MRRQKRIDMRQHQPHASGEREEIGAGLAEMHIGAARECPTDARSAFCADDKSQDRETSRQRAPRYMRLSRPMSV